jgi:hypothetical protein
VGGWKNRIFSTPFSDKIQNPNRLASMNFLLIVLLVYKANLTESNPEH